MSGTLLNSVIVSESGQAQSSDKKRKENSARKASQCHIQQDSNTDAQNLITSIL
jgi:hypothetical protein